MRAQVADVPRGGGAAAPELGHDVHHGHEGQLHRRTPWADGSGRGPSRAGAARCPAGARARPRSAGRARAAWGPGPGRGASPRRSRAPEKSRRVAWGSVPTSLSPAITVAMSISSTRESCAGRIVEPEVLHGIVLSIERPEREAGRARRGGHERIGDLDLVRPGIARQIRAGAPACGCVDHDLASCLEEVLGGGLFPRPKASAYLGPGDRAAIGRNPLYLGRRETFDDARATPEDLDDDVRVQEQASYAFGVRRRRVSRRRCLTYSSVPAMSFRLRHRPSIARRLARRWSAPGAP